MTPQAIQQELDAIEEELARRKKRNQNLASPASGSQSFRKPTSFADNATRPPNDAYAPNDQVLGDAAHVLDVGIEGGIPLAAQVLSLGNPAVTGIAGGAANVIAQSRRMMFSGQKNFNLGEAINSTMVNSIPVAGPGANIAQLLMRPGKAALASASAKEALKFAGGMYAGKTVETTIDQGRYPNAVESALAIGPPAALGAASVLGARYGDSVMRKGRELADTYEALKQFGKENLTPGALMPSTFAKIESQLTETNQMVRNRVDTLYSKIEDGLRYITSPDAPLEGATLSDQINKRSLMIKEAEKRFATLGEDVVRADKDLQEKTQRHTAQLAEYNGLNKDRIIEDSFRVQNQVDSDAEKNLNKAIGILADKATRIASSKMVGSSSPLNPAEARNTTVQFVTEPLKEAYDNVWKRRYGTFDNDKVGFDTAGLQSKLEKMKSESRMTSEGKSEIDGLINNLKGEDGDLVSLGKLRDIRAGLFNASGTLSEKRVSKGYAQKVSNLMDDQFEKVFPGRAAEFKGIQSDYAKYSDLWEMPGIEMFFVKNPTDDLVTKVVAGIQKSGTSSDEYKNIQALITHIAESSQESGLAPALQKNTLLAATLKGHVNDIIRSNIILTNSENGRVDPQKLVQFLSPDSISDHSLSTLGFGSKAQLRELALLSKKNQNYSKLSPEELGEIFSSESFKKAANGQSGSTLADLVNEVQVMKTIRDNLVAAEYSKQLGLTNAAAKAEADAQNVAKQSNKSREDYLKIVNEVRSNPVYQKFSEVGSDSWNGFVSEVLDPKSAKVNNAFVQELMSSLKNSPDAKDNQLLKSIQQRYIEDHLKKMRPTEAGALITEQVNFDAMANLTKSDNPDFKRAQSVLAPDQLKALEEFSKAAKAMFDYEAIGSIASRPPSRNLPVKQQIRKSIDGVVGIFAQNRYNEAAALLANPESYRDALFYKGEKINKLVSSESVRTALNVSNVTNRMINQTDKEKADALNASNFNRR